MSKKLEDVVITSALRTPIGTYKGSLKDLSADKLGALVIKEVINKSNLKPDQIDEVITTSLGFLLIFKIIIFYKLNYIKNFDI